MANHVARGFFGLAALLFVWAAYLQLNDPDPVLWTLVYFASAIAAGAAALARPLPTLVPLLLCGLTAAWSMWLAAIVMGGGELHQMFPDEEATGVVIVDAEEGREMGGLAIVAVTMALVAVHTRRARLSP